MFFAPSFSSSATASGNGWMRCTGPLAMSAVVRAFAADRLHVGALRHQVLNHLDVAARRGVVQRGVAFVVEGVDVGVQFLDQVLHGGQHAAGREAV